MFSEIKTYGLNQITRTINLIQYKIIIIQDYFKGVKEIKI